MNLFQRLFGKKGKPEEKKEVNNFYRNSYSRPSVSRNAEENYNASNDLLNPLNPLSPISPFNPMNQDYSEPTHNGHSHDYNSASHSHDYGSNYGHSHSDYSSGSDSSSSYDSGSSYSDSSSTSFGD